MYWTYVILASLLLSSCGGIKSFQFNFPKTDREIASVAMEKLLAHEEISLSEEIQEKLISIHSYYIIGLKNLNQFDQSITEKTLKNLYEGRNYQSLLAVKTQIDEIEAELITSLSQTFAKKRLLKKIILSFSEQRAATSLSMQNLSVALGLETREVKDLTEADLEKEVLLLNERSDFQVFEKNIQHLSHLMELNIKSQEKKFNVSEMGPGNITGQEFPKNIWSLTFSNGPGIVTKEILKNLKAHDLKATFFQIAAKTLSNTQQSVELLKAKMEIGAESYTNKDLSKVGSLTLEKEISTATSEIEMALKIDVKFFRLPYASGANVPNVRALIAKNNLIHVMWNVDSLDWMAQYPDRIVERTRLLMKKTRHDSGIILFHDVHPRSVKASSQIMKDLKLSRKTTCLLDTIVKDMNKDLATICSKNSL